MIMWYQEKAKFHYKQWEVATEQGKEKAANAHMLEYLNYIKSQLITGFQLIFIVIFLRFI